MSEDLSERAKRILGDLGDGSPIGDMTAALDEVERLRAAMDGERAAVVAWLRGQAQAGLEAAVYRLDRDRYDYTAAGDERTFRAVLGMIDAIERGKHRGEVKR